MPKNLGWLLIGVAALAACGDEGPLRLDEVGVVQGVAYVDMDLDGKLSSNDRLAPGVTAALVVQGTADTVARAVAGPDGGFRMLAVEVGRYTLLAGRGTVIGDSLQIMPIDSADLVLAANDTVTRLVRLSYATITIAALAQQSLGRTVAIEGIALNTWATFGDSTIHLLDPTGFTRAVRLKQTAANEGDSIRVFGQTGLDQGRTVLLDGTAQVLAPGRQVPPPTTLTTAALASAQGGQRGYAHVRVTGATIVDTARVGSNRRVGIDDGSGRAELLLDSNIAFVLTNLVPGATVEAIGVLAPATGAAAGVDWQLKPRRPSELIITFPTVNVAAARASAPGVKVAIEGVALNSWNVFGDSTVHIKDASGAVRGVRVVGNVSAGDSIRLLGTMAIRNGQPVVGAPASATRLLAGVGVPEPDSISTAVAANARGGRLDADLVRVAAPILGTNTQPNQDLLVTIDDGSGQLQVLFDRTVNFNTASLVPGAILNVRGLLIPTGTGTWRLWPRGTADFTAVYPTVTVANARTLPQGKTVYINGIALTGWSTFADHTVYVTDGTASIRVLGLSSTPIFAGDSVRILGTRGLREGQPVLNNADAEVQLANVGLPPVPVLSTAAAARAEGGSMDASQVRTSGTIKAVRTDVATNETLLDIDDGSGILVVRLDRNAGFTGTWNVNDRVDVRGVLNATSAGSWELKPRSTTELTVTPAG